MANTAREASLLAYNAAVRTMRAVIGGVWEAAPLAGVLGPDNGVLNFTIGYYVYPYESNPQLPDATYVARIRIPPQIVPAGVKNEYFILTRSVMNGGRKQWGIIVSPGFATFLPPLNTEKEAIASALRDSSSLATLICHWLAVETTGASPPEWLRNCGLSRP